MFKINHFIKVKLYLFTHPQRHLVLGCYEAIPPSYILSQIKLEAKGYGIKNFIANFMDQFSCTLDPTNVLEYSNQGRVLLLLVSKQNLKSSSWRI
jgi:hypothetical protein